MNYRRIAAFLLLAQAVRADYKEDLEFARRLGQRGLEEMALQILDKLEKSSDPAAARAGRYGKAELERGQATLKRNRFLRDLEDGVTPRVPREEVLAAYSEAKPKIEDYVANRADDLDARFLLAELLQDYAEFLTGKDYPETMAAQREKLVSESSAEADKLFAAAIGHYDEVAKRMAVALGEKEPDLADPNYVRLTQAQYKAGNALMRLAILHPKGPKFNYNSEAAIEKLDAFLGEHYSDLYGAFAMLDLGTIYFERGLRLGTVDDAETGANYFKELYTSVKEDPQVPETSEVIAKSLYWYARACNAMARGEGALAKPRPVQYDNAIMVGAQLREKLKQGAKNPWALKALLEVAEAYAAQNRLSEAVAVAAEVLGGARLTGQRQIGKDATDRLTGWVSRVSGTGVLGPELLFQMGEALAAQGRTANAIAFCEKAVATAATDEEREKAGYPALVRIAREYRKDKRNYAAAEVAGRVVADYVKSGQGELSDFGVTAAEACNLARLAWKEIAEETKRPQDDAEYQKARRLFVEKFPGHPENSDQAFATARELFAKGQYEAAAKQLADIGSSSRNYWQAQRMVPGCYRQLAFDEKDPAKSKAWHEKTLAASTNLVALASAGAGDDPQVAASRQQGELLAAFALASLERWPDALKAIDAYLGRYGDPLLQRGAEFGIKVDAHLAQGQLTEAEAALAVMLKRAPPGPATRRASYSVFKAVRDAYQKMGAGPERVATAGRAAAILETWLEGQKDVTWDLRFLLAEVLFDAGRFGEAADAYEAAAALAPDERRQPITLNAAEAKYQEANARKDLSREEKIKILEKVRDLFTDVLVPPDPKDPTKAEQKRILHELANAAGYPKAETFKAVKRMPRALYVAALIYSQSSPAGMDGRYLALRLITVLHEFTVPVTQEDKKNLDEFIPIWWDAAELKLKILIAIAQSGTGAREKAAATEGLGYARKLGYETPKMDGPAREAAVKALEAQLKSLAPK
jgi:hypothetical protein